jgi:2-phospho-L-lactate guanylyltransferase (CobY/MobA/RfbA family)
MRIERALVLAGARPDEHLAANSVAAYAGVTQKPLIAIDGEPMLARVVGALKAAGVTRIGVSTGDPEVAALALALGCEPLAAEAGPSHSTLRGVEALGTPVLITTADHALLRPEWVTRFVADAPAEADIAVLLAERAVVEAAAPGTRRTYLRFADGDWSGCNLFLARNDGALGAIRLWRSLEANRKRPWKIVGRLGPLVLVRYLLRMLTLREALARLGELSGAKAAAVGSPYGLAAVDVDKPVDLDLVRKLLGEGV